jgi:hypothetical protein
MFRPHQIQLLWLETHTKTKTNPFTSQSVSRLKKKKKQVLSIAWMNQCTNADAPLPACLLMSCSSCPKLSSSCRAWFAASAHVCGTSPMVSRIKPHTRRRRRRRGWAQCSHSIPPAPPSLLLQNNVLSNLPRNKASKAKLSTTASPSLSLSLSLAPERFSFCFWPVYI